MSRVSSVVFSVPVAVFFLKLRDECDIMHVGHFKPTDLLTSNGLEHHFCCVSSLSTLEKPWTALSTLKQGTHYKITGLILGQILQFWSKSAKAQLSDLASFSCGVSVKSDFTFPDLFGIYIHIRYLRSEILLCGGTHTLCHVNRTIANQDASWLKTEARQTKPWRWWWKRERSWTEIATRMDALGG